MRRTVTAGFAVRVVDGPDSGLTIPIESDLVLGRNDHAQLTDPTVGRQHARLQVAGDEIWLTDLGTAIGTTCNGEPLDGYRQIRSGDELTLGLTRMVVLRCLRFHQPVIGPCLVVRTSQGEHRVQLVDGLTIGRDVTSDLVIPAPEVSRLHAVVRPRGDRFEIEDLGSSNGTTVNGQQVVGRAVLHPDDVIELGRSGVRLHVADEDRERIVAVRVGFEGEGRFQALTVEVAGDAPVSEVTSALATACTAPVDRSWILYRSIDGVILHPDDSWMATGTQRGDTLVLAAGDPRTIPADEKLHSPPTGGLRLNQLPRTEWPARPFHVERPRPPESTSLRGRGVLWQMVGGIGAIGIGLVLALVRPEYLVFGLVAGLIGVVTITASVLGDQSRRRHALADYRRRLATIDGLLDEEVSRQGDIARRLAPDVGTLRTWLTTGSTRIWERRPDDPDALRLSVGRGRLLARLDVDDGRDDDSPYQGEFDAVIERHRYLDDVPVCGPGIETGALAIVGDPTSARGVAARAIVEAACLHAPNQVRIWVIANTPHWQWCRWLPHGGADGAGARVANDASSAAGLLNELDSVLGSPPSGEVDLVVLDMGRTAIGDALPARLRGRGLLLVLAGDRRDLPNGLPVLMDLDTAGTATMLGGYPDGPVGGFAADPIDVADAESLALELGRTLDAREHRGAAGLLDLLDLGQAVTVDVEAAWSRPRRDPLSVTIGVDDSGEPVELAFRRDGPHGMVAGTTGSGKSELLQTLLAGLALTHSPTELNFFLIDFKGGATFASFASLPHVVGLVTDLETDSQLASRAFSALEVEIGRRKRLLDSARVPSIAAYEALPGPHQAPLPNLLVVIDEFALLVERQPEVRSRLDMVATQGRSLGIHLLLATQSPSGVVTHAIRANTNLWICLRVVTEAESMELLGGRDAAHIPDSTPGRGFVRRGASDHLRPVQTARIARPLPGDAPQVVVRSPDGAVRASSAVPVGTYSGLTELDAVVSQIVLAAGELGLPAAPALWLPPLPDSLPAFEVAALEHPVDRLAAVVGLADRPEELAQEPYWVDFSRSGHALLCGLLGSGKSTTLTQIATDLAINYSPVDLHLYGIESGAGSLSLLGDLPHTGAVIGVSETERVARLLSRLVRTVEERRDHMAGAGVGVFTRWRFTGNGAPWILLVIDDFPTFREAAEHIELGRPLEQLNSLLQGGPAVGIHVVVAINQAVDLRVNQTNLMPARLLFRQADSADFLLVDARFGAAEVPNLPPGRCIVTERATVQVLLPDPAAPPAIAEAWAEVDPGSLPRPVRALPRRVEVLEAGPPGSGLVVGLGGPEVEPVAVAFDGGRPVLSVAGPIGSGRSTTLAALLQSAVQSAPMSGCTVIALRPSPLRHLTAAAPTTRLVTDPQDVVPELDRLLVAGPDQLLVIDDAESLTSVPGAAERLDHLLRSASELGLRALVALRVNDLPGLFDPWARYLVSLRRAILLQPTADDAFLFGAKLPAIPPPVVPGRGVLIDADRVLVLQAVVAEASPGDGAP